MGGITIRCKCGIVNGTLDDAALRRHNHLRCYCRDCRAFALYVGNEATLDAQGGTEIVQVNCADVEITEGEESVACVNLKEGGLPRFYASCCNTPIGNEPGPGMPFIGLIHDCLQPADQLENCFGPVKMLAFTGSATGDDKPRSKGLVAGILRFVLMTLGAKLRGDGKRHPFFDASGQLSVSLVVLTEAERERLTDRRAVL